VYYGYYTRGANDLVTADADDALAPPDAIALAPDSGWRGVGLGPGWAAHGAALADRLGQRITQIDPDVQPQAGGLVRLAMAAFRRGEAVPADQALPTYLRDRVTHGG
jgi:tRNA threonylcarbamoyladenosine biosynthesis protein TsaB